MIRLEAIRRAAASYAAAPAPGVQRIGWRDISADVFDFGPALGVAVKGTDPENIANLARDADVADESVRDHPRLGPMFAGALDAAQGLLPQVLAIAGDRLLFLLGHSLGGQIAVDLTALIDDTQPTRVIGFWGFDPPKSGYAQLANAILPVKGNIDRFAGSIVNRWPFERGVHVRAPALIGDWTPDWLEAHSIERAAAWVAAREIASA